MNSLSSSLAPSRNTTDRLSQLALLFLEDAPHAGLTSDESSQITLITWLLQVFSEEQGVSVASVDVSPTAHDALCRTLMAAVEKHLPQSEIHLLRGKSNFKHPRELLRCVFSSNSLISDEQSDIPTIAFGGPFPAGLHNFAPGMALISIGSSPFLRALCSSGSEAVHLRRKTAALFKQGRDMRLLREQVDALRSEISDAGRTIYDLRIALRSAAVHPPYLPQACNLQEVSTVKDVPSSKPQSENVAHAPTTPISTSGSPLRRQLGRLKRRALAGFIHPKEHIDPTLAPTHSEKSRSESEVTPAEPVGTRRIQSILFVAGEPDTPGVLYRCNRNAAAAINAGFNARVVPCASVGFEDINWADVIVLWRVEYSGHVSTILNLAKEHGVITIFDADDVVFVPHFARIELIDGIRSIGANEARIEQCFTDMRRTLMHCDQGMTTTRELVSAMHLLQPVVQLLPNTFDQASLQRSRLALRMRGEPGRVHTGDGLVRIGYATGSRTHQRDFALVSSVLANILAKRPEVRLVLFREAHNHRPVLLMEEYPDLTPVLGQIEWRDMVPLDVLPEEFARFDISIAPLETGNVFCEAKSEIKFFEAALAGATTVASPTGPFQRAIEHGRTGFLARTSEEWHDALLELVDNPARRVTMARDAYLSVLWPFGPEAQARRMSLAFGALRGDNEAAQAAELRLHRDAAAKRDLPVIPPSETLFHHDVMGTAPVTIVITSYNYETHLLDALESVAAQTLPILDLVVVDDGSTDGSVALTLSWMERNRIRFNRLVLRRSIRNAGLGGARNIGMDAAETQYVMQLDADNILNTDACDKILRSMKPGTAYAYPTIGCFNDSGTVLTNTNAEPDLPAGQPRVLGDLPFNPLSLVSGNRIDAMAMVAKWAWAAAGGYYVSREAMGWEDFDLWCSFAEIGLPGHHVPEILAQYRQHEGSMTNASTERDAQKARVVAYVLDRHPWISLSAEKAKPRLI